MSFLEKLFGKRHAKPEILRIPESIRRIFAIGDVHGRIDLLEDLESRILAETESPSETMILLLGDMIDRGPFSAHVIDHVARPPRDGVARRCLMGNHEKMLLDALDGNIDPRDWIAAGGGSTLQSYGTAPSIRLDVRSSKLRSAIRDAVPADHVAFFRSLPHAATADGVLFSHAGGTPDKSLMEQTQDDLMSARISAKIDKPIDDRISIFGHMRQSNFLVKEFRICIDLSGSERDTLGAACVEVSSRPKVSFLSAIRTE
jgi:serine/threonine protein phosphatase 1